MKYTASETRYDSMRYNRCGRSGLLLPAISLGLWHNFGGVDPRSNGRDMLLKAFDLGITHFDLGNNYGPPPGSAEETIGAVLKSDLGVYRDELIISTKAGYLMWPGPYGEWGSKKYLVASLDQFLNAWVWNTSTSSIHTGLMLIRLSKRRWALSTRLSGRGKLCMPVYHPTRLNSPKRHHVF